MKTETVPLKTWLMDEGPKHGISGHGYYQRMRRGVAPWPPLIRHNRRRIEVIVSGSQSSGQECPHHFPS